MGLKDDFNQAIKDWIEHCRNPHIQLSSSAEPVRNCDAYRKIISMGREILPLLRQLYDTDIDFYIHGQDEKGEYAAFSTKNLAQKQNFMDALFAFQYGESAEESNAGFNQMKQIGQEEGERDLPFLIIKNHGLVLAVRELIGDDFSIPEEVRGKIPAIENYTKRWLDENMSRYVPAK